MTVSGVSTGHNGDGQRADFSGFPARSDEVADVGPQPVPSISSRHRWLAKVVISERPYKSEKSCRRCGMTAASLHFEGERGGVSYVKQYYHGLDRVDDGSGAIPPCDARLEIAENAARVFLVEVLAESHTERALRLATVIQRLCVDAARLGELETLEFSLNDEAGDVVVRKGFPRAWWPRLEKAVRTGLLMQFEIDRLVEIMMIGPR